MDYYGMLLTLAALLPGKASIACCVRIFGSGASHFRRLILIWSRRLMYPYWPTSSNTCNFTMNWWNVTMNWWKYTAFQWQMRSKCSKTERALAFSLLTLHYGSMTTFMSHQLSSIHGFIINYYHQLLSITINYHQLSSITIINYQVQSSTNSHLVLPGDLDKAGMGSDECRLNMSESSTRMTLFTWKPGGPACISLQTSRILKIHRKNGGLMGFYWIYPLVNEHNYGKWLEI